MKMIHWSGEKNKTILTTMIINDL